jgi:hypothetical protein
MQNDALVHQIDDRSMFSSVQGVDHRCPPQTGPSGQVGATMGRLGKRDLPE